MNVYPPDLVRIVRERCAEHEGPYFRAPPLPSDDALRMLLETAYNTSFLVEEGRRPGFRVILLSPDKLEKMRFPAPPFRVIRFERPRPYSAAEVNRLAPTAEMTRLLIGVDASAKSDGPILAIWGLLDVGESWWKFSHHERGGGTPPPNALTVSSYGPGDIAVSAQGRLLVNLRGGAVSFPQYTAPRGGPIRDFLGPAAQRLHDDVVAQLGAECWDKAGNDEDYPQRLYLYFLERILFNIRERRHGGTLAILPSKLVRTDTRIADRLFIKYPCNYDYVWPTLVSSLVSHRRYYDLHLALIRKKIPIDHDKFEQDW